MLFGSVTAAAQGRVIPRLGCLEPETILFNGSRHVQLTASLGHASEFPTTLTIPVGIDNHFSPGSLDRGQPESFAPGTHPDRFAVTWNVTRTGALTWTIVAEGTSSQLRMTNNPAHYCSPEVHSVIPEKVEAGETTEITIVGKNFAPDVEIFVRHDSDPTVKIATAVGDTGFESIVFYMNVPETAPPGRYIVDVRGPADNNNFSLDLEVDASNEVRALVVSASGALFAGTVHGGIYRSVDNGGTWAVVNNGLDSLRVNALTTSPDGSVIFAGTGSGVYRSTDDGDNWQPMHEGMR